MNSNTTLWNLSSTFDNIVLLNTLSKTVFSQPLIKYTNGLVNPIQQKNFLEIFKGGNACRNALRLLGRQNSKQSQYQQNKDKKQNKVIYFCKYAKSNKSEEKQFYILPFYGLCENSQDWISKKFQLKLDNPSNALIVNNNLIVCIEKKCITMYQIDEGKLFLKDYDSIGIGKRLVVIQLSHVYYKQRDYLLIFGNEKQDIKPYLKCLVYQIVGMKLKFIKKATLFTKQFYKPIILYDNYPNKQFQQEKFCIIAGGYEDYTLHDFHYGGLQIHLHLLLNQWLTYSIDSTIFVPFSHKQIINSGKAIKIGPQIINDECWLIFCTEHQTVSHLKFKFHKQTECSEYILQQIEIPQSKKLAIRNQNAKQAQSEQLFYSENSIYLLKVPQNHPDHKSNIPYRIYWCDKKMQKIRSRPLKEMLSLFIK